MNEKYENFMLAREKTILNSWELLKTSVFLFEKNQYAISCFLAMTSIEETGKLISLRDLDLMNLDEIKHKSRNEFFRNHRKKAMKATGANLYMNLDADQRHGNDPKSKIHRTTGVFLLSLSLKWMEIRNSCIYTDVNFTSKNAYSPRNSISREHAYYFICMAFEVLITNSYSEFGSEIMLKDSPFVKIILEFMTEFLSKDLNKFNKNEIFEGMKSWNDDTNPDKFPDEIKKYWESLPNKLDLDIDIDQLIDNKAIKFRDERLSDLLIFMKKWSKTVDLSNLNFLNNPDPLLKIVKDREGTSNLYECVIKYLTFFETQEKQKFPDELNPKDLKNKIMQ